MAVYQTRSYFLEKYGHLVDNPNIGPELAAGYWAPGNSENFMALVEKLTGKPFSADALVHHANLTADQAVGLASQAIGNLKNIPTFNGELDLDAAIRVIHGNETITEFRNASEFPAANAAFTKWVEAHYPKVS
jgi:hypothetical protein